MTATNIVSNAGIMTTYNSLLPKAIRIKHHLNRQLKKIEPSVAHISLYLGLKGSPQELNLPKTNYWIYPAKYDHDTCVKRYLSDLSEPFPMIYLSFPSAKDPDWINRYPGKSSIDKITLMPFEQFKKWE